MKTQEAIDYERVAEAIHYIREHFQEQPNLDELAAKAHLSPFHFQRLFSSWAGTSPKKFLQYISVGYAKKLLREDRLTLADAAFETGLSGTSRLHDLFIHIEAMTPAEFKNGGLELQIHYSFAESPFGEILVASTAKGICHLAFVERRESAFAILRDQFPNANFEQVVDLIQQNALYIFTQDWKSLQQIKLHLKGTDFQLKVWEALLKVPLGGLSTYGNIAEKIQNPAAARAVGTAIGANPVAFLIPCHRVIQSSGAIGGYMWGPTRKTAIIGWEAARMESSQ